VPSMTPNPLRSQAPTHPLVLMRFRPAWAYIDGIREFGRFFCETTFGTPDLADRACVIIQEALENAIKYSTKSPDSELELLIQSENDRIEFSVSSLPDPAHVANLRSELTGLDLLPPEEAYLAAFLRAASEPDATARLGLARIRYEGNVELSLKEEDGGRIRVTARGRL
jgi:two-component sensor histidine kinase